ncbi:FecR family protein [Alkalispirochaeta americana]|uniref:FecR family protein n=1 Tax=Alkalispirochaeta americana TaxID=159291 RepID=A0A1N6UJZ3_9SPIO|nr:FecR domain-containing protein [Alkalispirochaeta americana]SIQ65930.1 FecR family protein [Alkalispirochaeta americana]
MRFSRSDFLVSLGAALAVFCLGFAYYGEIQASSRGDETARVGHIVFRRRTATRRPARSLRWERLNNHALIYQGDTLRTAGQSEAGIIFDDGTTLDLLEHSLVALDFQGMIREIDFLEGTIYVGGDLQGSGLRSIRVGSARISADSAEAVTISGDAGEFSVDVAQGEAEIVTDQGKTIVVSEHSTYTLDTTTGEGRHRLHQVVPLWPRQNSRLIHQYQEEAIIPFRFSLAEEAVELLEEDRKFLLEIASSADFSSPLVEHHLMIPADAREVRSVSLPLGPGQWYWRLRTPSGDISSPVRRFAWHHLPPPRLLSPADNEDRSYRAGAPRVRFSWQESPGATAYLLEISQDREFSTGLRRFRTALPGLTLDELHQGSWYWRVHAVFPGEYLHPPEPSRERSFHLSARDDMEPVDLRQPAEGTFLEVLRLAEEGLSFSWLPREGARRYELILLGSPDPGQPLAKVQTEQPFLVLDPSALKGLAEERRLLWTVRWKDSEGSWSEVSPPRSLEIVDGRFALRALFPPDGYTLARSLGTEARFTWSRNFSAPTSVQISRDDDFSDPFLEERVQGESIFGRVWPPGTYHWRLRTYNVDGSVFLETPPRELRVVPPLDPPRLEYPAPGQEHLLLEGDLTKLRWTPVEGAGFYRMQLFREGQSGDPLFEERFLPDPSFEIPLGSLPSGTYRIVLQAFALESEKNSRLIGYRSTGTFSSRRLFPAELQEPPDQSSFPGLKALRQGVDLSWISREMSGTIDLELFRDGQRVEVPEFSGGDLSLGIHVENHASIHAATDPDTGETRVTLKRLPQGEYRWQIRSRYRGFDLSSRETRGFSVAPIPLLDPPVLEAPSRETVLGVSYLSRAEDLRFSWQPLAGANRYIFRLICEESRRSLLGDLLLEEPEFLLKDLSLLDRGTFRWEVRGQLREEPQVVIQEGASATSRFRVDLPDLRAPQLFLQDALYGY